MVPNDSDSIFLIDSRETAFMLGISPRTFANWRSRSKGPTYIRFGKNRSPVMYRLCDVEDWLIEHQVCTDESAKASGGARR